ncbi:unnamed protein product [Rotaria sp. Silwood2]|nr:unnamed protein product [Rotaria sp. Silwood2]
MAQAFIFDIQSTASLTSLIVVAKRIASPTDPNTPVAVAYVTINTNGAVKKLYTPVPVTSCHKCPKCLWTSRCCCHTVVEQRERGITPQELNIVKQKMTADQFIWFNQQQLSSAVRSTLPHNHDDIRSVDLTQRN